MQEKYLRSTTFIKKKFPLICFFYGIRGLNPELHILCIAFSAKFTETINFARFSLTLKYCNSPLLLNAYYQVYPKVD